MYNPAIGRLSAPRSASSSSSSKSTLGSSNSNRNEITITTSEFRTPEYIEFEKQHINYRMNKTGTDNTKDLLNLKLNYYDLNSLFTYKDLKGNKMLIYQNIIDTMKPVLIKTPEYYQELENKLMTILKKAYIKFYNPENPDKIHKEMMNYLEMINSMIIKLYNRFVGMGFMTRDPIKFYKRIKSYFDILENNLDNNLQNKSEQEIFNELLKIKGGNTKKSKKHKTKSTRRHKPKSARKHRKRTSKKH